MQLQKHTQMYGMKHCVLVFLNLPLSLMSSAPSCGEILLVYQLSSFPIQDVHWDVNRQ